MLDAVRAVRAALSQPGLECLGSVRVCGLEEPNRNLHVHEADNSGRAGLMR
jgi:hypothetical protein